MNHDVINRLLANSDHWVQKHRFIIPVSDLDSPEDARMLLIEEFPAEVASLDD